MKWAWMADVMCLGIAASAKTAAPKSALQREVPEAAEVLQMARFSSLIYYYKVLARKEQPTL